MVHAPLVQDAVALASLQMLPQSPQLFTSVYLEVSHPLSGLPSQLAKPVPHVGTHLPLAQLVEPWSFAQVAPQAPQLAVVVDRSTSHPVEACLSQSPNPELQVIAHCPPLHVGCPFTVLHLRLQAPQFNTLLSVFVSQPFVVSLSQFA
jgi:hypothetical protein